MTLLEEIQLKCTSELLASRDHQAIANAVNVGRTRTTATEIGKGTILETIGLTAGNAFLDVIDNLAELRHVKALWAEGRLLVSSPLVVSTIQSFVPTVLTQAQADALLILGVEPDPVSAAQVEVAMKDANGAYL